MDENILRNIVQKAFERQNIWTEKSSIGIRSHEPHKWQITFNSEHTFYCEFFMNLKLKVGCNHNYSSWPTKKQGIGTKMVNATEEIYNKTGVNIALIPRNAATSFWEKMKYKIVDEKIKKTEGHRINQLLHPYGNLPAYKIIK